MTWLAILAMWGVHAATFGIVGFTISPYRHGRGRGQHAFLLSGRHRQYSTGKIRTLAETIVYGPPDNRVT
jgi:hypothetical protein